MRKIEQNGSVHVVVVVTLVLALLVALGSIFWQNFLNKETHETANLNKPSTKMEAKLLTVKDSSLNSGYALKYPQTWQLEKQVGSDIPTQTSSYDRSILTSPSGNIEVKLNAQLNGGLGGICQDDYTLEYIETASIPSMRGVRYAAYVTSSVEVPSQIKRYTYNIYAQLDNEATRSVNTVGQNACKMANAMILSPEGIKANQEGYQTIVTVSMAIKNLQIDEHNQQSDLTVEMFKDATKSKEYSEAKDIVRSLHIVK